MFHSMVHELICVVKEFQRMACKDSKELLGNVVNQCSGCDILLLAHEGTDECFFCCTPLKEDARTSSTEKETGPDLKPSRACLSL